MKSEKEVSFKSNHKPLITILLFCLLVIILLKQFNEIEDVFFYGIGSTIVVLLLIQIYKQTQYDFTIKINQQELSYKNDKKVFDLKRIESFYIVPQVNKNPPKLIVSYRGKEELLLLENFSKKRLKEVSESLTKKIDELDRS
ncbi:hypothetical protein [Hanstruepera ponticola]|uniref:hypothetical protein n=1 Tax=Hanstruepera ponticola TaxID=2042995 RepID=UPI0017826241|nr:hypothetical protein [Hanstruepera ponticola]